MDTGADQCTIGGPAWVILDKTGEEIQCNGYLKGEKGFYGPTLPVVSAATCAIDQEGQSFLLIVHQACYYNEMSQDESLCLPFQAEQHGVSFDLTPNERTNANGEQGTQRMIIEDKTVPLLFDGRKLYIKIQRPSKSDFKLLQSYELTSPEPFIPKGNLDEGITARRKNHMKQGHEPPGGIPIDTWQKRLGMAPIEVIQKTFKATTQYATNVEAENRTIGRRHYKSRFPFLREKRVNDEFHSDTFFPSVHGNDGSTCSQMFIGKDTDYMFVYPMKKESHSFLALQDFGRKVGLPRSIKTDNAKTETGLKWTTWCREYCVDSKYTEPHSPWQNRAEHAIGDLSVMVRRCMRTFNAPLNRHQWCQRWCVQVRNHLASRKLGWRTATEKLTGNTPDISMFRFHFWEEIEYFNPGTKQPEHGWLPGRFLGIAWDVGDHLTYFIETEKAHGKNVILARSTIRSRQPTSSLDSGEHESDTTPQDSGDSEEINFKANESKYDVTPHSLEEILAEPKEIQPGPNPAYHDLEDDDDANKTWNDGTILSQEDDANLNEQLDGMSSDTMEDYEFDRITDYKWNEGTLTFTVLLRSGKDFEIPFSLLKKDRPIETAKYIKAHVVENKRGGFYNTWANKTLTQMNRTIRRMHRYFNIDLIMRLSQNKELKKELNIRRVSRNHRVQRRPNKIKFGIKVPNNIREALILDKENGNNLWSEAIQKEMTALNDAAVFIYHPPSYKVGSQYQYAPLRIIFDVKQEDLRRKARMVAGGHVVNSTMHQSYSSVVHTRTVRLLQTIAMNEDLNMLVGDIGNAFVQAYTEEKIWSRAGPEFGDKEGSTIIFNKALYGLATSARRWNLALGDVLKEMGFNTSRADADLWIKIANDGTGYEYIATHVDDVIVVAKDPKIYMTKMAQHFPIKKVEENPSYYLGNNLQHKGPKQLKVSLEKYIKEVLRRHESDYGELRKENVPHSPGDHPEMDDTPYLDSKGVTLYQSIIGTCQWISVAGRMDITFAVASLNRFAAHPREGHLKRAVKIYGYLKKYPKKGYIIDPRDPLVNIKYKSMKPDFGNQYSDFVEEKDPKTPEALMKELEVSIFVDSNHGHDKITGKSVTGIIVFVGRTPVYWESKRQSSVHTSTFGAEFISMKKAVEEAVTTRYYLRSMGVKVSKPTIIYADNLSAIKNSTDPSSPLKKKYLALSYHFCREHFSAGIVNIRKIDGKDNYADPFTKGLVSTEFHGHYNQILSN